MSTFFARVFNKLILSSILLIGVSSSSIIAHGTANSTQQSVLVRSPSSCKNAFIECKEKKACQKSFEAIEKCHPDYTDLEMIKKCQNFVNADFISDHALFTPITCAEKNITYWNVYCGICNFEKKVHQFERWSPWLSCWRRPNLSFDGGGWGIVPRTIKPEPLYELNFDDTKPQLILDRNRDSTSNSSTTFNILEGPVNDSKLLNGLNIDNETKSELISVFDGSTYYCSVLRVLPARLKSHAKSCAFEINKPFKQEDVIRIFKETIIIHFSSRNDSNVAKNQFCSASTDSEIELFCDYANQYGETCSENLFLNQTGDSICKTDGHFWSNSSENAALTGSECSNHTSKKNTIYVCGPSEARVYKKIKRTIFKFTDYVSTFLLFLYLVISANKLNLRSLPKRIFYSYSISLWFVYISEFILKHIKLCAIKYYVFFYIWQSHSLWILITSYDLWRIVYDSLKLKLVNVEGNTARFLVYCFVGWGLPAAVLVGLFPTLEDVQKSWTCPMVSGFQNEFACFSRCELNKYTYYFGWVSIVIFLLIAPCLLVLTCAFVCLSRRNRARSNVNRTYTVTMMKVAVMMGFHWMLLVYLTLFDSGEKFNVVYEFISSFHGSFIFFAFGLEKNTLEMFRTSMLRSGRSDERTQGTSFTQNSQEIRMSDKSAVDAESEK